MIPVDTAAESCGEVTNMRKEIDVHNMRKKDNTSSTRGNRAPSTCHPHRQLPNPQAAVDDAIGRVSEPCSNTCESRPRANENRPPSPIHAEHESGAKASMPTHDAVTPACPACGQAATQTFTRDLDETTHEGTYVCAAEHIWTTKWFAAERSA